LSWSGMVAVYHGRPAALLRMRDHRDQISDRLGVVWGSVSIRATETATSNFVHIVGLRLAVSCAQNGPGRNKISPKWSLARMLTEPGAPCEHETAGHALALHLGDHRLGHVPPTLGHLEVDFHLAGIAPLSPRLIEIGPGSHNRENPAMSCCRRRKDRDPS
jgi:hypothetical protein